MLQWTQPQFRCPPCEDTLIIYDPWWGPPPDLHIPMFVFFVSCWLRSIELIVESVPPTSVTSLRALPSTTLVRTSPWSSYPVPWIAQSSPGPGRSIINSSVLTSPKTKQVHQHQPVRNKKEICSTVGSRYCPLSSQYLYSLSHPHWSQVQPDDTQISCGEDVPLYRTEEGNRQCLWHFYVRFIFPLHLFLLLLWLLARLTRTGGGKSSSTLGLCQLALTGLVRETAARRALTSSSLKLATPRSLLRTVGQQRPSLRSLTLRTGRLGGWWSLITQTTAQSSSQSWSWSPPPSDTEVRETK